MPDLRNSYIGANYRRAEQKFSNYGTRRLRFYTIEVAGYNANQEPFTEEWDQNFGTGAEDSYAYKNPPGSIIEAILRGVALVAETYYVSWYNVETDGDYPYTYITVAVAGDTFLDGINQYQQTNNNAYSLANAVADALGNDFYWENVNVWAVEIVGQDLVYDSDGPPYALTSRTTTELSDEKKAARTARLSDPKVQKVSRNG